MAPITHLRAFTFFCCILTSLHLLLHCTSLSQDGVILLKIKKGELRDKLNALSDWNESHQNPCSWTGISCDTFNTVTTVDLSGISISGNLTSAICGLPNLTALTLQDNDFTGPFPIGLLQCKSLRMFDLSINQFAGMLPSRISELSELRVLNLAYNAFSGFIPPVFGMLTKLEVLFLDNNNLSGAFPNFVGNLVSLKNFTIGNNPMSPGLVPIELGNLKHLQQLLLYNCSLVGGIPSFWGNLTQLEELDLSGNHLSGDIPSSLMVLSNLRDLFLNGNNLSGQIPANIGQLRRLCTLDLSTNPLRGAAPDVVSNLTDLNTLHLSDNRLTGEIPAGLGELRYLSYLNLFGNKLSGWLPQSLGTFSNLIVVDLEGNDIEGPLPKNLCRGGELDTFVASSNNFNGTLPSSFQDCKSLVCLRIQNNQLSGEIPPGLWNSSNLIYLFLSNNKFTGEISASIGEAKNLNRLEISNNRLQGRIPAQVGQLTKLEVFEASNNHLSGPIPHELEGLSMVNSLQLDHNFLSGEIPKEITLLKNLSRLNLSHNRLRGEIPAALNDIMNSLDLSNNLLSGGIPPELGQQNLDVFNVSNNDLAGRIPDTLDITVRKDSFLGNPKLCGGQNLMLPACSNPHKLSPQTLATILVPLFLILTVTLCSIFLRCLFFRKPSSTPSWKLTSFHSTEVDELYILHNLKEANVIGSGVAGKVYKVILQNGQAVAVKKIGKTIRSTGSLKRKGEQEENKTGEVEVDTLGLIRHNNILKLLCCISSEESEFKLLVYEFMPNGSLFDCMHGGPERQKPLQWPIRYQIALDAARGLSYLHHDCSPPILHRDVKSSNILLDGNFEARIADFGVSRLIDRLGDEYTVSIYVGSHGYIAPEYVERLRVDEKSDVYSFGVVMLELVSGRKATGEMEYGEGVDIVGWIRNTIWMGGGEKEVLDERVVNDNCMEQMMRVLHMGLICTKRKPKQRPCMREVVQMLVACGGYKS